MLRPSRSINDDSAAGENLLPLSRGANHHGREAASAAKGQPPCKSCFYPLGALAFISIIVASVGVIASLPAVFETAKNTATMSRRVNEWPLEEYNAKAFSILTKTNETLEVSAAPLASILQHADEASAKLTPEKVKQFIDTSLQIIELGLSLNITDINGAIRGLYDALHRKKVEITF